jgi:hypothetical protein
VYFAGLSGDSNDAPYAAQPLQSPTLAVLRIFMMERLGRVFFAISMLSCEFVATRAAAQTVSGDNQTLKADSAPSDDNFFSRWRQTVIEARASQPNWSSPLVTTSVPLQNRLRFDTDWMHSGNGTRTVLLDDTRGLALIVGETTEIQIAAPSDVRRRSQNGKSGINEFGDWPFFRLKERLASSPQEQENYVLSAFFQVEAPTGNQSLSNKAWTYLPSLGFGKGWEDFDIQGVITASLPAANAAKLGHPLQTNIAFQYRIWTFFTPEVETNWTYFPDGQRAGLHQLFLTAGIVIGRFPLTEHLRFTVGAGYEFAVAPPYRPQPLAPAFDHSWVASTRFNFE